MVYATAPYSSGTNPQPDRTFLLSTYFGCAMHFHSHRLFAIFLGLSCLLPRDQSQGVTQLWREWHHHAVLHHQSTQTPECPESDNGLLKRYQCASLVR